MKYRKKPVEIEAIQYNSLEDIAKMKDIWGSEFCNSFQYVDWGTFKMTLETLEGVAFASQGDYIIRGLKGEFYPCKPDIFVMTYEAVGEN